MYIKNIYAVWSGTDDADDSDSDGDDEAKEGEPVAVVGGFGQSAEVSKRRRASSADGFESSLSDPDDYADPGPDAAERGFVPSCGPSPVFQPQRIPAGSEDMLVSPMLTGMEGIVD